MSLCDQNGFWGQNKSSFKRKRQGSETLKWLPQKISVRSGHLENSGVDVSCCKALPTLIYGRKLDVMGIFRPVSQIYSVYRGSLSPLGQGTLGEEWVSPPPFPQRPAGTHAPSIPRAGEANRLWRAGFGALQSYQPRHS